MRTIHVAFSCPAESHGYYAELAAVPPEGVVCRWPPATGCRPGQRRPWIKSLYDAAGLPFAHPVSMPADAQVLHACQHLPLSRMPWVVDIEHGQPFVGTSFRRLNRRSTRHVILWLLSRDACCAILPWSPTAARAFVSRFDPPQTICGKIHVIPPAVRPRTRIPRAPGPNVRLLFVSNAPSYNFVLKGGRELVEAFLVLRASHPQLELTLAGDMPPEWRERCQAIAGVMLTGLLSRDQLAKRYDQSDIYVMPSVSDTFGMVYLEAMSAGLPVVALDRPYTRDIVSHRGTGLLVRPGARAVRWCSDDGLFLMDSPAFIDRVLTTDVDPHVVREIASAVDALVRDGGLRTQLGERAREEIETGRFSIANRNRELAALYRYAVEGSRT